MLFSPLKRRQAVKAAENADDVELRALLAGPGVSVSIDEGLADERVSEEGFEEADIDVSQQGSADSLPLGSQDDEPAVLDDVLQGDAMEEERVGSIGLAVQQRADLLGSAYPFVLDGNSLHYRGSRSLVYEFCLSFHAIPNVSRSPFNSLLPVFERLVCRLAESFLGAGARGLRCGFPPQEGSPSNIRATVAALELLRPDEWKWDVRFPEYAESFGYDDAKDGGLDGVVWKSPDGRPGGLILLINAGCGKNWWVEKKYAERPSRSVARFVKHPDSAYLNDLFALPYHILHGGDYADARQGAQIVFDRIALSSIADRMSGPEIQSLDEYLVVELDAAIRTADADLKPARAIAG